MRSGDEARARRDGRQWLWWVHSGGSMVLACKTNHQHPITHSPYRHLNHHHHIDHHHHANLDYHQINHRPCFIYHPPPINHDYHVNPPPPLLTSYNHYRRLSMLTYQM